MEVTGLVGPVSRPAPLERKQEVEACSSRTEVGNKTTVGCGVALSSYQLSNWVSLLFCCNEPRTKSNSRAESVFPSCCSSFREAIAGTQPKLHLALSACFLI